MSNAKKSEASGSVPTPKEDDDVFVEQHPTEQQAGPSAAPDDPSSSSSTTDVFFEKVTNEVKQWLDDHNISERRQEVLRARFARAQEFARDMMTTVSSAVGNVVKRVGEYLGSSDKEAEQQEVEKLLEALRQCQKERVHIIKDSIINEVWAQYAVLVKKHDGFFDRTKDFRIRFHEVSNSY